MAGNPSKPSNVDIKKLKAVVEQLQSLSDTLTNPPPGRWTDVQGSLEMDLKQGDGTDALGIQGDLARGVGNSYADNLYAIGNSRTGIQTGVQALIGMINTTIAQHGGADDAAATNANQTNTTQQGTARGGH